MDEGKIPLLRSPITQKSW